MRVAVLFSSGKDSCFACYKAMKEHEVVCLITLISKNPESYMFHTPNIHLTKAQAKAIGLPLVEIETEGKKEEELKDLRKAIEIAREKFKIEGVVTGAVQSNYQMTRIQRICGELGLKCFNPLWQVNQKEYMREFLSLGFKAIISGVFSYPFDESWLGRPMDEKTIEELVKLSEQFGITLVGEGGEFESLVLDGPIFKKRIEIVRASKEYKNYNGVYKVWDVRLVEK
jgi:ABC transporter with metal-binding/Fe-S-binding domain ATP-binding protein